MTPTGHTTVAVDPDVPNLVTLFPGTTIHQAQRELTLVTLRHVGGNKTLAAEMLGISLKTLYNWLQAYALEDALIQKAPDPKEIHDGNP